MSTAIPQGNQDIHVHVAVTVDGDRLDHRLRRVRRPAGDPGVVDLRQHPRERHRPAGQPGRPVDPQERRVLRLRRPSGTGGLLPEPDEGKPVSSGTHHPGVEVGDAIALAMCQIIPDRCAPQTYKFGSPRQMWGDQDPRTGQAVLRPRRRGQRGLGQRGRAGSTAGGRWSRGHGQPHQGRGRVQRAACSPTSCGAATTSPIRAARAVARRLRQPLRQGGPYPDVRQPVHRQPAAHPSGHRRWASWQPGLCTLSPGTGREVVVSPAVTGHLLETGDQLVYEFGGGGGWGDPLEREPHGGPGRRVGRVRLDRRCPRDYGVVITGSLDGMDLAVDGKLTEHCGPNSGEHGGRRVSTRRRTASASTSAGRSPTACCSGPTDLIVEKTPTTPEDQSTASSPASAGWPSGEGLPLLRRCSPVRVDRARHDHG